MQYDVLRQASRHRKNRDLRRDIKRAISHAKKDTIISTGSRLSNDSFQSF